VYVRTVLPDLPSAARWSRNELIAPWNTPAASGFGCRERIASAVIVSSVPAVSLGLAPAGKQHLRRSEELRGQGRGRTADLPLFRGSVAT
jgi:hypothetical protein